jgi:hypothetical protein
MIADMKSKLDAKGKGGDKKEAAGMDDMTSGSAPPPRVVWEDAPYSCGGGER